MPAFEYPERPKAPTTNFLDMILGAVMKPINDFIKTITFGLFGTGSAPAPGGTIFDGIGDFLDGFTGIKDTAASGGSAGAAAAQAIAAAQAAAAAVAAQGATVAAVKASVLTFQEGLPLQPFTHSMTNSEMTFDRIGTGQQTIDQAAVATAAAATQTNPRFPILTSAGFKTGDAANSNGNSSNGYIAFFGSAGFFTPANNAVYGGFLRAGWGGVRESFTIGIGASTGGTCAIQVFVALMDDTNGDIQILWASADLNGSIGSSAVEKLIEMPPTLVPDRGVVFVGVNQYGAGVTRPLYGLKLNSLQRDGLLYPAEPNARFGRTTALTSGTVLPASGLLFDDKWLPWLGIGQSVVLPTPAPTSFYEDFDGYLNSLPPTIVVRDTAAVGMRVNADGNLAVYGGDNGEAIGQITKKMNRDNHFIETAVVVPTGAPLWISVRADIGGLNRVACAIRSTGVEIVRKQAPVVSTVLASAALTIVTGNVIRLTAFDNIFFVHRVEPDGTLTLLLQYTDSGNALGRGFGYRWGTIGPQRNAFLNSGAAAYVLLSDSPDPE